MCIWRAAMKILITSTVPSSDSRRWSRSRERRLSLPAGTYASSSMPITPRSSPESHCNGNRRCASTCNDTACRMQTSNPPARSSLADRLRPTRWPIAGCLGHCPTRVRQEVLRVSGRRAGDDLIGARGMGGDSVSVQVGGGGGAGEVGGGGGVTAAHTGGAREKSGLVDAVRRFGCHVMEAAEGPRKVLDAAKS